MNVLSVYIYYCYPTMVGYYIGYLPMQGMIKIIDIDYFVSIYILPLSYHGWQSSVTFLCWNMNISSVYIYYRYPTMVGYYIGYLPMQGMIKIVDLDYFVSIYILPLSYHGRQSSVTFCF